MATSTITEYHSDLSGAKIKSDSPTVRFGVDGADYEIDLTDSEQRKMRDALAPFVAEARRIQPTRRRPGAKRAATSSGAADVRAWARENGHDVPERGRIPSAVREAYATAH